MVDIKNINGKVICSVSGSDLRNANLSGAYLRYADLREANLACADLGNVDLAYANLRNADLRGADLRETNLGNVDLAYADLRNADLRGADLRGANLGNVDLAYANLAYANLRNADLRGTNLRGARLGASIARLTVAPPDGPIIGWKKCKEGKIVKLLIPAKARRSNSTGRKCRADKAKVTAIYNRDGSPATEATSTHDEKFVYRVGETVEPINGFGFDTNRWKECAAGIHFFITREEAENY